MRPDAHSLERLVPEELEGSDVTGRETLLLHLARYEFAARHARPGRVLDMACGVGYGTRLLADRISGAREVVGVDRSPEAVQYAAERYGRPGVRFAAGDALAFEDPLGFDSVVSLETVEHVADPERLLDRLVAALRPGGILVASVPTTPSADVNPHHLHDFSERSFRRMGARRGLREVDCLRQVQPYRLFDALRRSEARMQELRPDLLGHYARHPGAALRRLAATLRFGFTNRYLTVAWQRP
jgi:SAM-dependent methyltransferase